jgi:hypothetical protein
VVIEKGRAHLSSPQLLSDIQVFRSSRNHSTGTMPPSASDPIMPELWNWKPHFWITLRRRDIGHPAARVDLVDVAGAEDHVDQDVGGLGCV